MGRAKFWPPGAPKPLIGFRWNLEYIIWSRACKSTWRCEIVGGLGEHMKKNTWCGFLGIPFLIFFLFFALFFGSRPARKRGPILTIYTSYDVFPPKDVPFGVSFILLPILGVKSLKKPYFGGVNRHFKLNVQNIKICILSKLLHRLQPNYAQSQRPTNTLRGWSQHA